MIVFWSSCMTSLYLFCGGESYSGSGQSKPLDKIGRGMPLVSYHYEHVRAHFQKIVYLVEVHEIDLYKRLLPTGNSTQVNLIPVPQGSTTLEKLRVSAYFMDEKKASVSYPDIFSSDIFWQDFDFDNFRLLQVPIKSRFPRVYTDNFVDQVKGVTNYQSRVPANPHFIFGGKFDFNVKNLHRMLKSYNDDSSNKKQGLEISFFDFVAQHESMQVKTIYDPWFHVDSERDYKLMNDVYG